MEKTLPDPKETFTIDLVGVGDNAQTARPTILVTCTRVATVKDVLSRRFKFDRSIFSLRVRAGKLRRSLARLSSRKKAAVVRRSAGHSPVDEEEEDGELPLPVLNGGHQDRPLCGASIGAYKNGKHLPAVSYGGVVMVDGEPYGMTVHHSLDNPSDDDEGDDDDQSEDEEEPPSQHQHHHQQQFRRSSARRPQGNGFRGADQRATPPNSRQVVEESYLSDISGDELSPAGESDDEADLSEPETSRLDYSREDIDSIISDTGDIPGVNKGHGRRLLITQPAIDDVESSFFPDDDDKDEDHLSSHSLGWVHASSGIRRWRRDRVTHEIDWALLNIEDHRLQPHNLVLGGRRYCREGGKQVHEPPRGLRHPICRQPGYPPEEDLFPNRVAGMQKLGNLKVHCMGRTSGLQSGVISPAMSSVRVTGRRTASRSWHVLGGFGG